MRIVIASDLHANLEALAVLPRSYDQLWVLGDLVNYGPNPAEVVDFARRNATLVVRGNHDHAIGFGEDPRCHGRFQDLAEGMRDFTQEQLRGTDREFLRSLPLQVEVEIEGTCFYLCHAIPSDPLFGYAPPRCKELWTAECSRMSSQALLVGHTHIPFVEKFGECLVVNPGSVGLPSNSSGLGAYALWEDGRFSSCWTAYELEKTLEKVEALPVAEGIRSDLVTLFRRGELPSEKSAPDRTKSVASKSEARRR